MGKINEKNVKKGKSKKKFSTAQTMLDLISEVNDTAESKIGVKLERMNKVKEYDKERKIEKKKKNTEKFKRLNEIKSEILNKGKNKSFAKKLPEEKTKAERILEKNSISKRKVRFKE
ncbi:hypothetical protein HDU92_003021 [Lobulomyces angularis]|nr:hypothetical protein HDU92_003021 [Lobulomyces angularis]